jgi:7-cyano-7-deazaguanine synthase
MTKSIVLLSGGLDSSVLFGMKAKEHGGQNIRGLFVNYGQPAVEEEWDAAQKVHDLFGGGGLLYIACGLCLGDMDEPGGDTGPRVVPARNLTLISIGVNAALSYGANSISLGATAGDYSEYVDCRPEFVGGMHTLCDSFFGVSVSFDLSEMSKADVVTKALEMDLPIHITWSCYTPHPKTGEPCGSCNSCKEREAVCE